MTTASREDHFGEIGRGSDFELRARRVGHREMSYPGPIGRAVLGSWAVLIGALEAGKQSETKEPNRRAWDPTGRAEAISTRAALRRLYLGFHPLDGEAHQACPVLQLQLLFEMLAVGLHGLDAQMQV